ncbi:ORF01 [Psittacine aviadenovirus B]|uniref:ORF01 n=1 Tax=psittacine adenovirus 4 TaxID=2773287 RepID=A0A1P8SW39_9ADEN|nr:ORF01 [Psittacine aviadenovirus B]APY28332.1 ORF01 [psittacine adenovirus 4]
MNASETVNILLKLALWTEFTRYFYPYFFFTADSESGQPKAVL